MLVVELSFPGGRFHGTPWGRHVNEGVPEWPPSPYRLVRALVDAWKRKRPHWPQARVEPLLAALASEPPWFRLPPATATHTRSFQSANQRDPSKRSLVFDAFVVVSPRESVLVGWPGVGLSPSEQDDLDELLSVLNYLGRSESWVSARVLRGVSGVEWNCGPVHRFGSTGDMEIVSVACPVARHEYDAAPYRRAPRKRGGTPQTVSWLEAIAWETGELLSGRRDQPPAFQQVAYARPSPCFEVRPSGSASARQGRTVHGVVYALESTVLPPVSETVELAERARRKLMGIHKAILGDPTRISPRFSGKDVAGRPLKGHRHLYYLPMDRDEDGRLDHLVVVGRTALETHEQVAMDRLHSLWQPKGRPDVRCIPIQWGTVEELFPAATTLRSVTPFVPPRHYRKGRGDFAEWLANEVRREAQYHGLPAPVRVTPMPFRLERGRPRRWLEYRRSRKGERDAPGYGFEIEFCEEVHGPVALGYGAHFGLGLFL